MLAVKGQYDGKVVRLFQPVEASKGAEVIVTFVEESKWIHRLTTRHKLCSLAKAQKLLSTLKAPLAETVIEEREERF